MKPAEHPVQPAKSEVVPSMEFLHISLFKGSSVAGGEGCGK
jgi:hypothetical protein